MKLTDEALKFVKDRYVLKFPADGFEAALQQYEQLEPFSASGNHAVSAEVHLVMRLITSWYLREAFEAMKIDLNEPNVAEDLDAGNIGSFGRIAKVWCGAYPGDDTELGGGRWAPMPRLATFPNSGFSNKTPITKRVDLVSNCSHHFVPFGTLFSDDSYAIVSYIPNRKVLGISKLQRLVNWVAQRFWLQEDLTHELYRVIAQAAETEDVMVELHGIRHGCEFLRGAKSKDGAFTSVYYQGRFADPQVRALVK